MEAFDMVKNPGEEYPSDSDGEGRERLRSTETLEDVDNDIETFDGDIETFDEPDNKPMETFDDAIETFENSIENNEIEPVDHHHRKPIYLGNDLTVNEIAAAQGWTPHPDAELIDAPADLSRDTYINELAAMEGRRPHPDAEVFEPLGNLEGEKDLSGDTLVNELSLGRVPYNPDAEFIVDNAPSSRYYYRTEDR